MKYEPIEKDFEVKYCDMCQGYMVICPKCGNNCCNAGYGKMDENGNPVKWQLHEDGMESCDVCHLAYQYQDLYWKLENMEEGLSSE